MYNIVGLLIVLLFVALSKGWRGKLLPLIISLYYAAYIAIDASQFSVMYALSDTVLVSNRDVASAYLITSNSLALMVILCCCISTSINKRNRTIPLIYSAWLLVFIFLNTAIHIINWDGNGVSSGIITIFQLSCITADGLAAMLGGDNLFSRYFANRYRSGVNYHRRSSDFKNTSEYSQ
ncbi:TMhelix containing protein [Vibrio phage 1.076.O._10N.286.51.B7]|nr:TMhelix containing protein [Vibrio phage 1.076.O._10N.286.51.B7]